MVKGKFILLLFLSFIVCPPCMVGQTIVWEKAVPLGPAGGDQLNAVTFTSDFSYLAGGRSMEYSLTIPGNSDFPRAVLTKINSQGDTTWVKLLPSLGTVKGLHPMENGLIWAVIEAVQPFLPANNFFFPRAILLANDSIPIVTASFPQLDYFEVGDSYPTNDGGVIIFGSRMPSIVPGFQKDFYALKINALGQEVWSRPYPLGIAGFGTAGQIEPMANGRFFCSGSDGKRLVSFEIFEDDGRDTLFKTWYTSPGNKVLDFPAGVQIPGQEFGFQGTYISGGSNYRFFLGKFNSLGIKLWGGEQSGGILPIPLMANSDSSLIANYGFSASDIRVVRLGKDSSIIWSLNNVNSSITGFKQFYGMLYNGDDTGILVGSVTKPTNPVGPYFYVAKFSGVGYPYDPTGLKQPHLVQKDAFPFPNPSAGLLQLKKEYQKGEIHFFTLSGKCMKSETLKTKGLIDISAFPSGTYFYRAILDNKPHTGKIIKQ